MLYEWIGLKPHRRYQNVMAPGRGQRVARVTTIEIRPGEVFEPTPDELTFFHDMLRPVGTSLRVAEPVQHSVEDVDPDVEEAE